MKRIGCFLMLLTMIPVSGHAETKQEVLEEYRARYENFFERLHRQELKEKKRLAGRDEVKERRQEKREMHEHAREHYIKTRPAPENRAELFQKYLEKEQKEKKAYLKLQERFAQKQRELEKVKEGALKIPPVIEYQLQEAL